MAKPTILIIITITITIWSLLGAILAIEQQQQQQQQQQQVSDPDCNGRWIHIRNIPSKFNFDLLANCSSYFPLFDDFCPYLANHGLGQKTHNRSHSWFRTDPHMLDLVFHRRILEYPCLSPDPVKADAVFVPYYGGIDSMRYLFGPDYNRSHHHGMDLFRFLTSNEQEIWNRRSGHDHFLVMARPAWDLSQPLPPPKTEAELAEEEDLGRLWGTSFLMREEFFNVTVLTLESRAWPWQEVAVPHPTSFHPPSLAMLESWVLRVRRSRRSTLMLFAGGGGTSANGSPNIRRSIREECEFRNLTDVDGIEKRRFDKICEIVDCSNGQCEHDPIRYMKPMLQASFCLQPPGETPARRSTFDGMIAGCIPVFFEEQSAKTQYKWHLPEAEFGEFSVTIPKEEVVFKGLKVVDVLMRIPRGEVRRMREKVMEMIPRVTYRKHGSSLGLRTKKDAFDVAVDGTLQRIKDRLKQVSGNH